MIPGHRFTEQLMFSDEAVGSRPSRPASFGLLFYKNNISKASKQHLQEVSIELHSILKYKTHFEAIHIKKTKQLEVR